VTGVQTCALPISGIANLSTSIAETGTKREVDFTLLRKAQDIQMSTATQLIDAVQSVPTVQNLPAHLGSTINTKA
jgi:hypothetical protein